MIVRPKYLSSHPIHFHSLRDLSCKKLKENEREEAMNEKKKKAKIFFFARERREIESKIIIIIHSKIFLDPQ